MPYAHCHYPFENKEAFEEAFPADFIAEGVDQTRGWSVPIIFENVCSSIVHFKMLTVCLLQQM